MQRIFTLLLSLVLVSALGWAETVVYDWSNGTTGSFDGSSKKNMLTFKDGSHIDLVGNATKEYSAGQDLTVNGKSLKTIKLSNGAQNTYYPPQGMAVKKVTLYSYINFDRPTKSKEGKESRVCYWKELGPNKYTEETGQILTDYIDISGYDKNPDVVTVTFDESLPQFNFTNTGEQLCVVLEVELVADNTKVMPTLTYSTTKCEVNLLDENPVYPTLTVKPTENEAEILAGITYTSSDVSVATIAEDGTVTALAHGTTTITAKFEENDNYFGASASYTLTVVDPNFIDKTWDKNSWGSVTYTETTVVDGLTIYASENKNVKGGETLNFGGVVSIVEGVGLTRAVSFEVPGKVKITCKAKGSDGRSLVLGAGEWNNIVALQPTATDAETKTYYYTEDATTLYMYSNSSRIEIYSIHVQTIADEDVPEAPSATPVDNVLELDKDGNLNAEFSLATGNVLYYVYTEDATEPAEAPQRSLNYLGTTYNEAEGNTISLTGVNPGTLKYVAFDPATGMASEPAEVTVHEYGYTTGLTEISAEAEAKAEYFTVQGIRVAAPEGAGIYICRRGTEVTKIIVK